MRGAAADAARTPGAAKLHRAAHLHYALAWHLDVRRIAAFARGL